MLKVILSALLLTEFCAGLRQYHDKAYEFYEATIDKAQAPFSYKEISNKEVYQEDFKLTRSPNPINLQLYFEKRAYSLETAFYFSTQADKTYEIWSFFFDLDHTESKVELCFHSEQTNALITMTAQLYEIPDLAPEDPLFQHAQQHAYQVQLMTDEEVNKLIENTDQGSPKHVKLNTKWVQEYIEKANPLFEHPHSTQNLKLYLGIPIVIKSGDLNKLTDLGNQMPYM